MKHTIFIPFVVLVLTTLACSAIQIGTPNNSPHRTEANQEIEPLSKGDPAQGQLLFTGQVDGQFPCSNCHSLQPNQTLVGPSLAGIATTAATRLEGYTAVQYLRESITKPNAYIVEDFRPDIMPENLGAEMTEQQLSDLIVFLMTLK